MSLKKEKIHLQQSILIGFLVGFGALVVSVLIDSGFQFHALIAFFNLSAMIIIFGGLLGVLLIAFPMRHIREIPTALLKAFGDYKDIDQVEMSMQILSLAQKSRQEGILALESILPDVSDLWLRRSLQRVVDGLDREIIQNIMDVELEEFSRKIRIGSRIFTSIGGYAPTLGIIGTVMGLVHMLASIEDANKLGAAIAVAFLATFWGILSANMIFLPIAERVKSRDNDIISTRKAMIEGILSIQAGEPVRIIEEKLKVFMTGEMEIDFTERQQASGGGRNKELT